MTSTSQYLFFDNASTTQCCEAATELVVRFAREEFGNPSSSHAMGQLAARAIREARLFFAGAFNIQPEQVIFTGSGSEADNLAVYGVAMDRLAQTLRQTLGSARGSSQGQQSPPPRVLYSAIEHPAVRKTAQSLSALGFDVHAIPVDRTGQIVREKYLELLTPETVLVSIHHVNNIVGAWLPVEELARIAKDRAPGCVFHTDAVQAFGRVEVPRSPSPVDLVSVSAHKVEGPKGIGALLVLNKSLLKSGLRPLVWGGDQEGGMRSGTQNAGLIAGFHAAAAHSLKERPAYAAHTAALRERFREKIRALGLLAQSAQDSAKSRVQWNSPDDPRTSVPHIVSLSVPGFPSGPLAKLLEERRCLVSTGSACSSQKMEPDPVLAAMGFPPQIQGSAIRISFSRHNRIEDVDTLAQALDESIRLMVQLLGGKGF